MIERSSYSKKIKREIQKVRTVTGICCDLPSSENNSDMELLRDILIDNGNCPEVIQNPNGYKNKCCCKKEHDKYYTPTNIYKFQCQNFLDNYLGRSNINVAYINRTRAERKAKIDRILERYGRKCNKCGRCK